MNQILKYELKDGYREYWFVVIWETGEREYDDKTLTAETASRADGFAQRWKYKVFFDPAGKPKESYTPESEGYAIYSSVWGQYDIPPTATDVMVDFQKRVVGALVEACHKER